MADPPFSGARLVASAAEVNAAWQRLATAIQPCLDEGPCVLLGVLLGGMVPLVQIAGRLHGDVILDVCQLSRYGTDTRGGDLRWLQRPQQPLSGRTVMLVDDVFDQGFTLAELRRHCLDAGARRVLAAVLVRKHHDRARAALEPDFTGIETGDEYLFGCGMDYRGHWRHLDALYSIGAAS